MTIESPVLLTVKGIALEGETQLPILLLQSLDGLRLVSMPIGPAEASSIIVEMESVLPPRPLTHDIMAELFRRHRFNARRLEIYGEVQGKHLSRLVYTKGLRTHTLEMRPSDGVALALRFGVPILAERSIFDTECATLSPIDDFVEDASEILYLSHG